MPEETVSNTSMGFEKILSILILFILIFTSVQAVSATVLARHSPERAERVVPDQNNRSFRQDDYIRGYFNQSTSADFDKGDVDDTLITDDNEVKLDTYRTVVGSAEAADPRGGISGGTTTRTGDPEYQADRGGRIDTFTIDVGQESSEVELRVLKPTENENEFWVDEPSGSTEPLDPDSDATSTFDVDLPINKGDWIGLYTYGLIDAGAADEGLTTYGYDGKIGSTPRTMEEVDNKLHTMEADLVTHEEVGVFESSIHNCGGTPSEWESITWESEVPEDTELTIETRSSPDKTDWSGWEEAANGGAVPSPVDRYIQYRAKLESVEGSYTPVLDSISISYMVEKAPVIDLDEMDDYLGQGPYEVTSYIRNQGGDPIDEDNLNVTLYYKKDEDTFFEEVSMEPGVEEASYSAEIPDHESGTVIDYYIEAVNQNGKDAKAPPEEGEVYSFTVDKDPPQTRLEELDGEVGDDDWYTSDVEVTFDVDNDPDNKGLSDVDYTEYRTNDDDPWQEYDGPFTITESGEYEMDFRSVDMVGNEEEIQTESFKIDNDRSMTNIDPQGDQGENDWYLDDVEVVLETESQASGIDYTEYRIDGGDWRGEEWHEYNNTGPISIDESGIYDIEYRSVDGAGNEEDIQTRKIKVDKEDPEAEHELQGTLGENGWYTSEVEVELSAHDDISGVNSEYLNPIHYRIDDGNWTVSEESVETIELGPGVYDLDYYAKNEAGRTSSEESIEIKVDPAPPDLTVDMPETEDEWYTESPDITVQAEENGSGLKVIKYRCGSELEDDPDPEDWEYLLENTQTNTTQEDFETLFQCDERGELELEVRCLDVAGNEVVAETEEGEFLPVNIDDTSPDLRELDVKDTVWNNDMVVKVDLDDPSSGISDATLHYNTGDGWKETSMTSDGGDYVATIPSDDIGFSSSVEYYVVVEDNAGNEIESEKNEASIGVNWWYFSPIPVLVVLAALFFYWKKNREEQEELIPMKESKLSKIKKGKEQKLEEIEEEKEKTPAVVSVTEEGGERCDICGGPIDPQNVLNCSCGNVYHDDCLRVKGDCPACGEDYAAVTAYSEDISEEDEPSEPPSPAEDAGEPEDGKELGGEGKGPPPPPTPAEDAGESEEEQEGVEVWADETSTESTEEVKEKVKKAEQDVKEEEMGPSEEFKEDELDEEEGSIECPVCGNKVDSGSEECWACGADLKKDSEEKESESEDGREDEI